MKVYEVLRQLFNDDQTIMDTFRISPGKLARVKDGKAPVWMLIQLVREYKANPLYIHGLQDTMFLP